MGPLRGLRVLETATGVAGPYAGRLFAMLGADVVKVEPRGGDPCRRLGVDHREVGSVSPLFVHLNAGKRLVGDRAVDLAGALEWCDIALDARVAQQLAGTALDLARLRSAGAGRRLVVASLTAWGFDADDPGEPHHELLVQAMAGLMTETAADGREPLRFPGWQSQYLAGAYAAAAALGMLGRAGVTHVDVTWLGAALNAVEGGASAYLQPATRESESPTAPPGDPSKQAGFQVGAFPSGAFRCADGHVIPGTVRAIDWDLQCRVYGMPELLDDERFAWRNRWANRDELRARVQPWYDARTKRGIFGAALDAGWAAAMVMTAEDAIEDEHLRARSFLSRVTGAADAVITGRPWRSPSVAEGDAVRLEAHGESDSTVTFAGDASTLEAVDMSALRVLELTWAWAGPMAGRFLGMLGADVVRVEVGRYPDGWRTRLRWRDAGVDLPPHVDPDDYTWDAAALFNSLNRSKRGVSIDLAHEDGRRVFLELLDEADVLIANMTYSVLSDRGIEQEVHAAVDRGLVFLNMPALGATGPYRDMPGYGMLMEGMGGFSARFGYPDEGARASTTYYPDAIAGVHGAVAALAAVIERAQRGGRGSVIDLSQQETTWLQYGEAIALRSMEGREPDRLGNSEPGHPRSGVFPNGEGGFVADLGDGSPPVPCHTFQTAHASGVYERFGLVESVVHPITGRRSYVASPVRVDGAVLRSTRPAPVFSEHTDEVLRDWAGLDDAEIERLRASGAIGTVPSARPRSRP